MNVGKTIRAATPWTMLAVGSTLMGTILVVAPEIGRELVLALTGAWIVLAVARIFVIVGLVHRFYERLAARA